MLELVQVLANTQGGTGTSLCTEELATVISFIHSIVNILCLIIPVGLIVFGTIDLGKAVISSDEKEIKGATGKLIKRAVAAVIVFFIPTIVSLLIGLVPDKADGENVKTNWKACWDGRTSFIVK